MEDFGLLLRMLGAFFFPAFVCYFSTQIAQWMNKIRMENPMLLVPVLIIAGFVLISIIRSVFKGLKNLF